MISAGDEVKVKRTSGEIENDWYLWTDMSDSSKGVTEFTAPEMIKVMVLKPIDGFTKDDVLDPSIPNSTYIYKHVAWTDLLEWNK